MMIDILIFLPSAFLLIVSLALVWLVLIPTLLWIGLIARRHDGSIAWPFSVPPAHVFKSWKRFKGNCLFWGFFYVFRNCPGVIKWVPGRLLPRRWGFGICGFEFGDRGH